MKDIFEVLRESHDKQRRLLQEVFQQAGRVLAEDEKTGLARDYERMMTAQATASTR